MASTETRTLQRVLAAAAIAAVLCGCTSSMSAVVQSARQLLPSGDSTQALPLDPNFAYLRITRGRHVGLLWRGSTERRGDRVVEVYYGSSGQVLRLLDGRIVGALGLTTEWRHVFLSAPAWRAVADSAASASYERTRDVMPGYRTGIREQLVITPIKTPADSKLVGVRSAELAWFEEAVRDERSSWFGAKEETLPPTRYAVDLATEPVVVYAEQCLASDLCFTWQRWSSELQQARQAQR